jgi:DNA-binding NarL/FixJ family response regulator
MITVFLADDHAVVRDGLRMILEKHPDIRVIGEAADGISAFRGAQTLSPQVILMDISMPGMTGIEAVREIVQFNPESRIVILSMHAGGEYVTRAFQAGASGFLVKEAAGTEVVEAVRAVAAGRRYMSAVITDVMVEAYRKAEAAAPATAGLDLLSPREREILKLVAEGKSSSEIGNLLCISPKTVDTYRSRLMQKLGLPDLPALVKFAIRKGLVPLE